MASVQSARPLPGPPSHMQHQPFQPQYQQQYQSQRQPPQQQQHQPPYQPQHQPKQPQQQQHDQRPLPRTRSKSSFSFRSDRSHKSSGSTGKVELVETSKEKASRRLSTKADPRLAMSEAEPSAVASGIASKLAPLRAIQHKDANGNLIADPDRSNPTRSRWERPLDTIRSFEAAIDGNYSRKSLMRAESTDSVSALNNRQSYYGGSNVGTMTPRYPQEGYYGGRGSSSRPDGYRSMSRPDSYYDNVNGGPSNGYYPGRARYGRTASEPMLNNNNHNNMYAPHGNHQSYETVTTASGSGSSGDPLGYSTNPSSNSSSMDRIPGDQHGQNFPPKPPMHSFGRTNGGYQSNGVNQGQNGGPPPPPRKEFSGPPPVPIKLGSSNGGPSVYVTPGLGAGEKRKSWFGRRFSRN